MNIFKSMHVLKNVPFVVKNLYLHQNTIGRLETGPDAIDTRRKNVCSYSCMRVWEREQIAKMEAKRKKKKQY